MQLKLTNSTMNKINHAGVVEDVQGDCVKVRIVQTAACASCKVAAHCNASEAKEKIIDVKTPLARQYAKGDPVMVSTTTGNAHRAVSLAFGVPFVLMVAVIVIVYLLTGDEGIAALSGIASLLPYYAVLYWMRERIGSHFAFQIDTISN